MCLDSRAPALLAVLACGVMAACGGSVPAPVTQPAAASRPGSAANPPTDAAGLPAALATGSGIGSIGGTITSSADRAPIARARVVLTSPALPVPRVTLSGADGTYRFQKLPAASYSLSASRGGYASQEYGGRRSGPATPVTLGDGQTLGRIDFALASAGVLAGRILDEDDKPFEGATVDALVSRTDGGQATLVSMATAQSDDRGEFRLTGLPAGQYYVSAFDPAFANVGDETGQLRYTATYYPGVASAEQATRVIVTPGVEPSPIVLSLRIIRPARISGLITSEDGRQLTSGAVIMTPVRGEKLAAAPTEDVMILPDGSFAFSNVPPGRYQIRARGETEPGSTMRFATFNVRADGRDITSVAMVLLPGASVAGTVVVEAVRAPKPASLTRLRVRAPLSDGSSFGDALTGNVLGSGSYFIRGLMPGSHLLTVEGLQDPWVVKGVTYRGQDITDAGLDVDSRQRFDDVWVTITDVASEVSGVVRDGAGAAVPDATVLIVPLSQQFWTRTSRRFRLLRTDPAGRYRVRGLPAGEYRAAATLDLDDSEAYRPDLLKHVSEASTPLSLTSLEQRVLDLPLTSTAARRSSSR